MLHGFTMSPVVGTPQGIGVFLDGVRFNEPDAQEVNFDLIPLAAISRAALVRGSDPLFGRNALGGALLLFTRRGTDTPESSIEVGGGSFGARYATITSGGRNTASTASSWRARPTRPDGVRRPSPARERCSRPSDIARWLERRGSRREQ